MNLPIPKEPRGSHPLANCLRQIIKCLHMLQPRQGLHTKVTTTTAGTMISADEGRGRGGVDSDPRWS